MKAATPRRQGLSGADRRRSRRIVFGALLALLVGLVGGVARADASMAQAPVAEGPSVDGPQRPGDAGTPAPRCVAGWVESDPSSELELDGETDAAAMSRAGQPSGLLAPRGLLEPSSARAPERPPLPGNPSRAPPQA